MYKALILLAPAILSGLVPFILKSMISQTRQEQKTILTLPRKKDTQLLWFYIIVELSFFLDLFFIGFAFGYSYPVIFSWPISILIPFFIISIIFVVALLLFMYYVYKDYRESDPLKNKVNDIFPSFELSENTHTLRLWIVNQTDLGTFLCVINKANFEDDIYISISKEDLQYKEIKYSSILDNRM